MKKLFFLGQGKPEDWSASLLTELEAVKALRRELEVIEKELETEMERRESEGRDGSGKR